MFHYSRSILYPIKDKAQNSLYPIKDGGNEITILLNSHLFVKEHCFMIIF